MKNRIDNPFRFSRSFFVFVLFACFTSSIIPRTVFASATSNFRVEILALCGNNHKETGEQCDGTDLVGQDCSDRGFTSGTLSCNPSCVFDTTACVTENIVGGGPGGGGYVPPSTVTSVVFEGRAYPSSKIVILKDGQFAVSATAGTDAKFSASFTGVETGNYSFGIYAEDSSGIKSSLFTFPVYVTSGATTKVSGIFIAPTISADKSEVKRGDSIVIFGQSTPNSEITISIQSNIELLRRTQSDTAGAYVFYFDSSVLETGPYTISSRALFNGEVSSLSKILDFKVGVKNVLVPSPSTKVLKGDLNSDKRINLIDFSIAAYWYKRPLSALLKRIEAEFLSGDGKIDLVDFSILAFYWTG